MKNTPTSRSLFAGLALCLGSLFATLTATAAPTNPAGFAIQRGTNISHWLSQDFG